MIERRDLRAAGALAAVVCAVYAPALAVGFYSDDYQWLGRMNPTLERPAFVFTVFYRDFNPLLHASFLVDWLVGGGSAVAFHAQSILVHGACAGLVLLLCKVRCGRLGLAAAAAALWALNVRISEVAIWPAARGHALATLCVLAALLAAGRRGRSSAPLALALLALGLLAKETALFPMLLVPLFSARPWRALRLYAGTAALALAFVAFNVVAKPDFHMSRAGASELALKVPFILLRPLGLGDWYDFTWPMFAVVVAVFVGGAFLLRRSTAIAGLLWVAVCSAPVIPLDKLSSRYLYMMSIGYALALCGIVPWLADKMSGAPARRIAAAGAALGSVVVLAANLVSIQREIADYGVLSRPYGACVDALAPHLAAVARGESLIVVDVGRRDAIAELNRSIAERGNMTKLIPYRERGAGGLIELPDLLNTVRRQPDLLGRAVDPDEPGPRRWVLYDGSRAWTPDAPPSDSIPAERRFAVRWDDAREYFRD